MAPSPARPEKGRLDRISVGWVAVAVLAVVVLVVATVLLVSSGLISGTSGSNVAGNVWAFLGVVLGANVTLVGALLTAQQNRHVRQQDELKLKAAEDAQSHQRKMDKANADRLKLDTMTALLAHVSTDDGYLPEGRVAGAVATMIELDPVGTIAVRILGDVWEADAVSTLTAMGIVNRVLAQAEVVEPDTTSHHSAAAAVVYRNAGKLVPAAGDPYQGVDYFPNVLRRDWQTRFSYPTKYLLLAAMMRVLLHREVEWWRRRAQPVHLFVGALDDGAVSVIASDILVVLDQAGALEAIEAVPPDEVLERARLGAREPGDRDPIIREFEGQVAEWLQGAVLPLPHRKAPVRGNAGVSRVVISGKEPARPTQEEP